MELIAIDNAGRTASDVLVVTVGEVYELPDAEETSPARVALRYPARIQETHPARDDGGSIVDWGVNESLTIDFTGNLSSNSINRDTVRILAIDLYTGDESAITYAVAYEPNAWYSHDPRIIISPRDELGYAGFYKVVLSGEIRDLEGNRLDGNGNGRQEGSPADDCVFFVATQLPSGFADDFRSHLRSSIEELISREFRVATDAHDLWPLVAGANSGSLNRAIPECLQILRARGLREPTLSGELGRVSVDGRTYLVKNVAFAAADGRTVVHEVFADSSGHLVTDLAICVRAARVWAERNSRIDVEIKEAELRALKIWELGTKITYVAQIIRDQCMSYLAATFVSGGVPRFDVLILGVATTLANNLPGLALQMLMTSINDVLEADVDLSIRIGRNETLPRLTWEAESYRSWATHALSDEIWAFSGLTEAVWDSRASFASQATAISLSILKGALSAAVPVGAAQPLVVWCMLRAADSVSFVSSILSGVHAVAEYTAEITSARSSLATRLFDGPLDPGTYAASLASLYEEQLSSGTGLDISAPTAGAELQAGEKCEIQWVAPKTVAFVRIELSLNSGAAWQVVANAARNTGSYPWTAPMISCATCMLRITSTADDWITASTQTFAILDVAEGDAPSVSPLTLSVSKGEHARGVELNWNSACGKASYRILRAERKSGPFVEVWRTTLLEWVDSDVGNAGAHFYYQVEALVASQPLVRSNVAEGWAAVVLPPRNLTASVDESPYWIRLTWENDSRSAVDCYAILRANSREGPYTHVDGGCDATEDQDKTVKPGTTYWYRIQSVITGTTSEEDVYSEPTAPVQGRTSKETPSLPPSNIRTRASGASIPVTWDPVAAAAGMPPVRYAVYRAEEQDGAYSRMDNPYGTSRLGRWASATEWIDTDCVPGKVYWYKVAAVSFLASVGDYVQGTFSSAVWGKIGEANDPPESGSDTQPDQAAYAELVGTWTGTLRFAVDATLSLGDVDTPMQMTGSMSMELAVARASRRSVTAKYRFIDPELSGAVFVATGEWIEGDSGTMQNGKLLIEWTEDASSQLGIGGATSEQSPLVSMSGRLSGDLLLDVKDRAMTGTGSYSYNVLVRDPASGSAVRTEGITTYSRIRLAKQE